MENFAIGRHALQQSLLKDFILCKWRVGRKYTWNSTYLTEQKMWDNACLKNEQIKQTKTTNKQKPPPQPYRRNSLPLFDFLANRPHRSSNLSAYCYFSCYPLDFFFKTILLKLSQTLVIKWEKTSCTDREASSY